MISKEEVVSILRVCGYDAQLVDAVVVVWVQTPMTKQQKGELRQALKDLNYRGSWGYRVRRADGNG